MNTNIEAQHASLQCGMNDWLEKALPVLARQLNDRVKLSNGDFLTIDAVTLRMADAAMASLLASVEAAGLNS